MTSYLKNNFCRMLLDIQIPDWDERFLKKLDPERLVRLYQKTGVDAVMFYCQSHVGLCNWPTRSGQTHRAFAGRDFVAEMLRLLHAQDIKACGYYSVIYNNWAFLEHPDWRVVPAAPVQLHKLPKARYGHCCPNNPDYRAFVMTQTDELISKYAFDAFFFDMVWWPTICVCEHCQKRFRSETGSLIPGTIDWCAPAWCQFQRKREQWLSEFARDLRQRVRQINPGLPVYHNFAVSMFNWTRGLSFEAAQHHDFLGGDFYGDPLEQLLVSKLMTNLSQNRPVEFMTSKYSDLTECVRLKNPVQLQMQAHAASAFGAAFFVIDTIHPDGTVDSKSYKQIRKTFDVSRRYAKHLGGEPVEDIGVYFSSDSKMSFAENGTPLSSAPVGRHVYPHMQAVRGAVKKLQEAHLPFGVITRRQLPDLQRYKVIVLPNVLRMSREECEAFKHHVEQGGRLYASRFTSFTESDGTRHRDFMLSELFGCHFHGEAEGQVLYLNPVEASLQKAISPQRYVSHWKHAEELTGALMLQQKVEGLSLATCTLPYGHPHAGSVFDEHWASIHTYPPWKDSDIPMIVKHRFGQGEVIYSAADLEAGDSDAHGRLFLALLLLLRPNAWSFEARAHPAVWVNAFHQPEQRRFVFSFLNYQQQLPPVPVRDISLRVTPPAGHVFTRVLSLPEEKPVAFTADESHALKLVLASVRRLRMLSVHYQTNHERQRTTPAVIFRNSLFKRRMIDIDANNFYVESPT